MSDQHGPDSAPLSLDLRQEKKRRRNKVGTALTVIGVALLLVGIRASVRGGADLLGAWGIGFGLAGIALGVYMLRKAATSRW